MHRSSLIALLVLGLAPGAGAQQRPQLAGTEGAVVADHPLAALAGADVLRGGGNAVDAAVAMAAVLAVVQPHRNGIGGDAFLLYREASSGRIHALNGSGRSAEGATAAYFAALDGAGMPDHGLLAVTVPGALRLWADVLRRHGSLPLASVLAPAIRLADDGFVVTPRLSAEIDAAIGRIERDAALRAVFLSNGRAPAAGTVLRQRDLAATLRLIARDGADVLYVGEVGQRVAAFMAAEGGLIRIEELAGHSTLWQEPIATTYHGTRILTTPPNSHGLTLLLQLNMAEGFDLRAMGRTSTDYTHTLVRLSRLAAEDRERHVADPVFAEIPLERLLSKEYARSRVASLRTRADAGSEEDGAAAAGRAAGDDSDAVFLAVIDAAGNMVAVTQSLYARFGSGRMVPGTGIVLHNGGAQFTLDAASANVMAPNKRPAHALMPALALRADGSPLLAFGTPGGGGQAQLLQQVLDNVLLFGMGPQHAVEAPRWRYTPGRELLAEASLPDALMHGLAALGYAVATRPAYAPEFGGVQIIAVLPNGVRLIGADPRREAYGIAW